LPAGRNIRKKKKSPEEKKEKGGRKGKEEEKRPAIPPSPISVAFVGKKKRSDEGRRI